MTVSAGLSGYKQPKDASVHSFGNNTSTKKHDTDVSINNLPQGKASGLY